MITLLLKSSLIIVLLLAFYKLFLEKESFFAVNRIYLLGCLGLALLLPFIVLPKLVKHQGYVEELMVQESPEKERKKTATISENLIEPLPIENRANNEIELTEESVTTIEKAYEAPVILPKTAQHNNQFEQLKSSLITYLQQNTLRDWLLLFYFFGVVVLSLNLLAQLANMFIKIIRNNDKIKDDDGIIVNMNAIIEPCSFFNYIFINPASYDFDAYEQIIAHEKIHVQKGHTFDLLLAELGVIALWFNPFIWLFRKEVEKNIEYQTDDLVINNAFAEKKNYQMNLLKIATYNKPLTVVTNYNQSLIKQRILKMNSKKSTQFSYWKYAFLAPLVFALLLFLNKPIEAFADINRTTLDVLDGTLPPPLEVSKKHPKNSSIPEPLEVAATPIATSERAVKKRPITEIMEIGKAYENDLRIATEQVEIDNQTDCEKLLKAATTGNMKMVRQLLTTFNPSCMPYANWKDYENMEKIHAVAKDNGDIKIDERNGLILVTTRQVGLRNHAYNMPDDFGNVIKEDCVAINKAIAKNDAALVKSLLMNLDKDCIENSEDEDELADLLLTKKILRNGGEVEIMTNSMIIDLDELVVTDKIRKGPKLKRTSVTTSSNRQAHNNISENQTNVRRSVAKENPACKKLLRAIRAKNVAEVKDLLKDIDPNCVDAQPDYEVVVKDNGNTWKTLEARTPLVAAARAGHLVIGKLLTAAGAKINFHHRNDEPALNAAAENGSLDFVKYLIENGADIDETSNGYGTALNAAARNGHHKVATYLIGKGANVTLSNNGQGSALNAAARNGHLDVIKLLMEKGADIDEETNGQGSALNAAARNGHIEAVKLLIELGADLDVQNNGQGSALNAAARNGHEHIVELLVKKGANINLQTNGQGSALNAAARNGDLETVKWLIDLGADLDVESNGQGSALNAAARNGHHEVIKLLVKKGANIDAETNGQGSALNAAARNGHMETIQLLIDLGADLDVQNNGQGSALNAAARNGHRSAVKLLLDKGANINQQNNGQGSALNAAARNGHETTVKLLLDRGANVNGMTNGQNTALMAAVKNRHYDTAEILLKHGADPYLSPNHQETPLGHAYKKRNKELIKLLEAYKKAY